MPADWICPGCSDPTQTHEALGLCSGCYQAKLRRFRGMTARPIWTRPCAQCGAIRRIKGHSLCNACYQRFMRARNRKHFLALEQKALDKKQFGGRRDVILAKFNRQCAVCGMTEEKSIRIDGVRLSVHHRDGKGHYSPNPNHDLNNLVLLCRKCHRSIHVRIKRGAAA